MKRTLALTLICIAIVQSSQAAPPIAQEVNAVANVVKASKLASLKKFWPGIDTRFAATLTLMVPVGWLTGELVWPHAIKGLCALEAKTSGKNSLLVKKDTCDLYYGDPKTNSCQVANNGVALMFPNPADKKTSIRFVGNFGQGKLLNIHHSVVTIDSKKTVIPQGIPVEIFFDGSERAAELRFKPSTSILKSNASEDDMDAFAFYDEVGTVMRAANNECKDGMYDKTIQQIMQRHGSKENAALEGKR